MDSNQSMPYTEEGGEVWRRLPQEQIGGKSFQQVKEAGAGKGREAAASGSGSSVARKGLAQGGAARHRSLRTKSAIDGVSNPAIRRLARRGGCKRIAGTVYAEARSVLRQFLERIIRDTIVYTVHSRRVTVTATDVCLALKKQGTQLYGYGNPM